MPSLIKVIHLEFFLRIYFFYIRYQKIFEKPIKLMDLKIIQPNFHLQDTRVLILIVYEEL